MHSFTSLLLPVHRGIRLHGISSRRGSPPYCSPQAPLGINDASSSINSCKFLSTAATTRLWQHRGFCPVCAIRGRDLQQKQRGTNSLGTSYWSAHHSTPLTTYLGFPDFNIPTECSIFPEALRGEQMSAEPPKNSCFVSLPVGCCFWGTMIRVFAHTFN